MSTANLIYLILLASFIGLGLLFSGRLSERLRHAAIWLGIFAVIFVGYTLRHDFSELGGRLESELFPGEASVIGDNTLRIVARPDGHFQLNTLVDGIPVTFLVDTGASQAVLSRADAARLGIDVNRLVYDGMAMTANGRIGTARVQFDRISANRFSLSPFRAVVTDSELDISLLGMSFLNRLKSFSIRDGILELQFP